MVGDHLDGPQRYEEDLTQFSKEQRLVLAYHWYLSEVNNGVHDQFYFNDLVRLFKLEGDRLTIMTPPISVGGTIQTTELIWERLK